MNEKICCMYLDKILGHRSTAGFFGLINQLGNTAYQGKISSSYFFLHRNQLAVGLYVLMVESKGKQV
ncbi:MAG: hypothetical protein ABIO46_10845 [Chitinophagales bacterium]